MTQKACEWIDFDLMQYQKNAGEIQKDKDKIKKLNDTLKEVQTQFDAEHYVYKGTREEAIKAFQMKFKTEIEINQKTMLQKYISPPHVVQSYTALEILKLNDKMKIEYGFGMKELEQAIKTMSLNEDKQYKAIEGISKAAIEKNEKEFVAMCSPTDENRGKFLSKCKQFGKA